MTMPTLPRVDTLPFLPNQTESPTPQEDSPAAQNEPHGRVKLEKVYRLCRKNRRGAAAVEFAIVAPVFFLMIFGMIEFGRMVMVQQVITNASREGARLAVLDGTNNQAVKDAVDVYLAAARVSGASTRVFVGSDDGSEDVAPNTAGYGDPVGVVITIAFSQVSWLPSPMIIGGATELTASTVMRRETVQ